MENSTMKRRREKIDVAKILRKSWYNLRLSVRYPSRVQTWDAIILTAASPEQAELYHWHLIRAKRMGRIAESTKVLAVPDPDGARIGSGAATINAISVLSQVYSLEVKATTSTTKTDMLIEFMRNKHILLLHAGGDSKRVPWANPMGKVFLPLPYLAADDPDGPVPLLFDHILAIASLARQGFRNKGGIFIMTGDVLPCFDASTMVLPEDSSCIITVPITLDIASNHGVIVASKSGTVDETYSLTLVQNLLQKPSLKELVENQAVLHDGRALLDTGIIAVRGEAWINLLMLAKNSTMISDLLKNKKEISLYEDVVAAWVPARHEWLKLRPFGKELINGLGSQKMFSYCAYDLSFLHFGTSSEILDHLAGSNWALVGRRHLCSIPATTVSDIASSAIILSSQIAPGVSVGEDTVVYDSSLLGGIQLGSQSVVVGVNIPSDVEHGPKDDSFHFILPDRHCLWEVPLVGRKDRVIIYCGLHDNPKVSYSSDGTFCGRPWKKVLRDLGIPETELWNSSDTKANCLWNAKVFPVLPYFEMLSLATWLMGLHILDDGSMFLRWRMSERISLEELHKSVDFKQLCLESSYHQADLAAGIAKACIAYGLFGRNLSQLCEEILQRELAGVETCKELLALCPNPDNSFSRVLPRSRAYQVQVDLLLACREDSEASALEKKVWVAIADETALSVKYGFGDHQSESIRASSSACQNNGHDIHPYLPRTAKIELAVRVDFVGGWSDTPPWSLERYGCVLNMAICLEGSCPVGTIIETTTTPGVLISDDNDGQLYIENPSYIASPFHHDDPFRLVKSALLVSGVIHNGFLSSTGLKIQTWANVPRGSGLGTSSILAAAVVKGLLQIIEGDESNENVARLVLVLEQIMGTGGGWQDQIGGLYPGIKFTASFPGVPLQLQVIPLMSSPQLVLELEQRLLVVFTGQVRLANQVLQKVVTRYLQHDNLLITSIKRLVELAKIGREALMNGDIDELGEIMLEAWRLHQELDPYCSNESVDRLFEFVDPLCSGYKLVGAGGGGFALLLAKSVDSARELRHLLETSSDFSVKVYNWSISQGNA